MNKNEPLSVYFPDHPFIPKNRCPEGAKTPRVRSFQEVGPLAPFLDWTKGSAALQFLISLACLSPVPYEVVSYKKSCVAQNFAKYLGRFFKEFFIL